MNDLNDRITQVSGYDLAKLIETMQQKIFERENARATWQWMTEMRKPALAQAAINWAADYRNREGKEPALALAERAAQASPSYKKQLDGIRDAHKEYGLKLSQAKEAEEKVWAARTAISFLKHEMQNG